MGSPPLVPTKIARLYRALADATVLADWLASYILRETPNMMGASLLWLALRGLRSVDGFLGDLVQDLCEFESVSGPFWTRTRDLSLIRTAL